MEEMQELHCHACDGYIQFPIDLSMNGNHVIKCPKCGHEHCRVVKDGVITDIRWDQRNGPTINVSNSYVTYSVSSVMTTSTSNTVYMTLSWANSTYISGGN